MRPIKFRVHTRCALLAIAALMSAAAPAGAFVIATSDGQGNTTQASLLAFDAAFPYWRHVGQPLNTPNPLGGTFGGGGTAVYIGNRWVLGVAHNGTLNLRVTNGAGATQDLTAIHGSTITIAPDLIAYRVVEDPNLPNVAIRGAAVAVGDDIVGIGRGINRLTDKYYWRVNTTPATWQWDTPSTSPVPLGNAPAPSEPGGTWDAHGVGFRASGGETKRWGTNEIAAVNLNLTPSLPTLFATLFNDPAAGGTTYELQGVFGDSGGGAFIKNGLGQWQLAGITHTVGNTYSGQPAVTSNSIFGNATFFSDLSQYSGAITALVPEPASAALVAGAAVLLLGKRRR